MMPTLFQNPWLVAALAAVLLPPVINGCYGPSHKICNILALTRS
jgi:hypothetical protein